MKFILIATVIWLPLTLGLSAQADIQPNLAPTEPVQTEATQLTTEEIDLEDQPSTSDRDSQLNTSADQINHDAENARSQRSDLRSLLNLPRGMVIRGTKRGGLAIGTEL